MKNRNLGLMIVFTIITFGIYLLVWSCKFQGELKKETGEGFSAWGHFFVSLFTFGIYGIYWTFAVGKRLEKQGAKNQGIIYLILSLLGLSIISYLLMQNEANSIAKN